MKQPSGTEGVNMTLQYFSSPLYTNQTNVSD